MRSRIASTQAIISTDPAAAIRWPIMLLIELMGMRGASSPKTRFTAAVSIESFSWVPVPWAEMYWTPGRPCASSAAGSMPACESAPCIAAAAPRPSGWMSVMRKASALEP